MKVYVDADKCLGHGICMTVCPQVFRRKPATQLAEATVELVPSNLESDVHYAASVCPEAAIQLT
jgi:ferredoxin